jgi:hypothetical protein
MKMKFDRLADYNERSHGADIEMTFDNGNEDSGICVRVCSYDSGLQHKELSTIRQAINAGKKVSVIIKISD